MFTFAEVAKLADMQPVTLRMWFERGHFALQPGDQRADQGGIRYLSPITTLAICIAAALTQLNVPISRAASGAMAFAHTAMGHPRRKHPAALYDGPARTLLAMPLGENHPRIFPFGGTSDGADVLLHIGKGATVLPVNSIVERIERAATQLRSADAAPATARIGALKSRRG